nr:MAG TPA: terminase small subunit [Caudoviricetes sp.]
MVKAGEAAEAFWRRVVVRWELRTDELRILQDACVQLALVDRLQYEADRSDVLIEGSRGQLRPNPIFDAVRQHRLALTNILKSLNIPESDEEEAARAERRHNKAVKAARTRWAASHGKDA